MSLLGYEVIESPNNLNFSRGYLFNFAGPFTHTGVVANYAPTEWLTAARRGRHRLGHHRGQQRASHRRAASR